MITLKERKETEELLVLRILNARMTLSSSYHYRLLILEKGYAGELLWDSRLESLGCDSFLLKDLLLEFQETEYQIDALLIMAQTLFTFDVKTFEGDYYISDGNWYSSNDKEIKNPLLQQDRCHSLLRRHLQSLGFTIPIESRLIFIHPQFHLYNAPRNSSMVFPTQLTRFLDFLDSNALQMNAIHKKLAEKLVSLNITKSRYSKEHCYSYEALKKGLSCWKCQSLDTSIDTYTIVCHKCGSKEEVSSGVVRNVEDLCLLFPEKTITVNLVADWCGKAISDRRIRRILKENFVIKGHGKHSYYEKMK